MFVPKYNHVRLAGRKCYNYILIHTHKRSELHLCSNKEEIKELLCLYKVSRKDFYFLKI